MTNGFPHFSAFGLVAQCNFVHCHKIAAERRTRQSLLSSYMARTDHLDIARHFGERLVRRGSGGTS
jgi:hypothetical protein